jgi:hypothetical protein
MLQIVGGGREGGREGKNVISMSEALWAADKNTMNAMSSNNFIGNFYQLERNQLYKYCSTLYFKSLWLSIVKYSPEI